MLDRIITGRRLRELIDDLGQKRRVVGPVARNGHYFYEKVRRGAELDLGFTYCVYGPKTFLFPSTETLFTFHTASGTFKTEPVYDEQPMALVGVHPFGGFNMSGTDSKAGGRDYLLLFTQAKAISEKVRKRGSR